MKLKAKFWKEEDLFVLKILKVTRKILHFVSVTYRLLFIGAKPSNGGLEYNDLVVA